jgi:hypothetical protein
LLFFDDVCFFALGLIWYVFRFVVAGWLVSAAEEPPLKFASFFIHVENGRRRPGRSARSGISVSGGLRDFLVDARLQAAEEELMSSALTNGLKRKRWYEELMSVPCECCAASVVAIVWNLESEERRRIIWAVDRIKRVKS